MNKQLERIENICLPDGDNTSLSSELVISFPDLIQTLFQCKVFGENILALPNPLDESEHQRPFHFVNSNEKIKIFEQEFREAVPNHFHLIGYFYFSDPFILYNEKENTIHSFYVSDIVDLDFLRYKLKKPILSYADFLKNIQSHSLTCMMNSKKRSEFMMIEMRNSQLYCDHEYIYGGTNLKGQYLKICKERLDEGFEIHYAPKWILDHFKNYSSQS